MENPDTIYRLVFDALPALVFVVDEDVRIHECNAAAECLLQAKSAAVLQKRAGDVLHCLHAAETPQGCGRAEFCRECVIRNAVTEAFRGSRVVRSRTRLELATEAETVEIFALISASPFRYLEKQLALLVVEDIGDIAELRRLLPICAVCKKVRDDAQSWQRLEHYFQDHWGVAFSHGLCPDCYQKELAKIAQRAKDRQNEPAQ
ncbi:MAG: PAS domain-containing protein [Deltaproteobacteria bacterium]|nr:PAS domain-containing protein [Deltaproteobacteria bacterium]